MTHETKEEIASFVDELEPIYPILCQGGGQLHAYSTGGVPTAYLIGADHTVAWHGHPGDLNDDKIEAHLKDVAKAHRVTTWGFLIAKALPNVPDSLTSVTKLLEKRKFGAALKKVESALPRLEGDDQEAGEQIREWIAGRAKTGLEEAAAMVRDGRVYKGLRRYETIEKAFKGHALSSDAKAAAKKLKSDKAMALEIKASEKFEKIKADLAGERKPEKKLKLLKPMLSKKYAETRAGREARELAEKIEGKVEK